MSTIKKVWTGTAPTHTFKDDVSGFGIFSAAQGLTPTGHTKVATISYRTFNTTTEAFGVTQTVEFYSNSGSSSGNTWLASVTGTDLILNSTGGSGGSPTVLGTMPDLSSLNRLRDVLTVLENAGLMTTEIISGSGTLVQTIYTSTGPFNIVISYYESGASTPSTMTITPEGYTITLLTTSVNAVFDTQSPAAGTIIYSDRTQSITITQAEPEAGTVLGTMPDLEAEEYSNNTDILDELATAGILSKTTSGSGFKKTTVYTVLCNSLTITNASGGETATIGAAGYSGAPATITKSKGQTFEYSTMVILEGYHSQYFTQSIAAGTSVTENTDITITTVEDLHEFGEMPSSMTLSDSETTILNTLVSADLVTLSGTRYIPNCTLVIAYRDGDSAIVSDASTRTYPAGEAILLPSWKSNIPSNTYLSAFSFAPSAGTTMYGSGQIVLRYTYKASSGGGGDLDM